jgi:transcriptional regulator with XRE-family HTH domain
MMTIGTTIRVLRQAAGFSQKSFADVLEITPSYLSLIEADKREATIPLLRRMAQVLGSPATVLFAAALGSGLMAEGKLDEARVVGQLVEAVRLNLLQERLPLAIAETEDFGPS